MREIPTANRQVAILKMPVAMLIQVENHASNPGLNIPLRSLQTHGFIKAEDDIHILNCLTGGAFDKIVYR